MWAKFKSDVDSRYYWAGITLNWWTDKRPKRSVAEGMALGNFGTLVKKLYQSVVWNHPKRLFLFRTSMHHRKVNNDQFEFIQPGIEIRGYHRVLPIVWPSPKLLSGIKFPQKTNQCLLFFRTGMPRKLFVTRHFGKHEHWNKIYIWRSTHGATAHKIWNDTLIGSGVVKSI